MSEWKKVKIGDFLTEREGRYKPDDSKISKYKRLDKIDFSGTIHISDKPTKTDMIIVHPGDLVISGINVAKGAVAVYQGDDPVCATIHYSSYTFDSSKVDLEYFKYFVKSPAFIAALQKQVKGGIKTEIKPKHLLPLEISIPELQTQQEIVKKISLQLKKTEQLSVEIESQKNYIKQLRQNILQDAIEGKLTADWRKQNPVQKGNPDYDAEALFEQIQKERSIEKKQKVLSPITDEEKPFEIPEAWKWVRLGELCNFGSCQNIEPNYLRSDDWILDLEDIEKDTGRIINFRTFSENNSQSTKHIFHKGYILYSKLRPYLNKVVLAPKDGYCTSEILPLDFGISNNAKYMQMVLMSPYFVDYTTKLSYGMKMPRLGTNDGKNACVPLPPLKEQDEIVNKVETLLAKVTTLENQIQDRKSLSDKLIFGIMKENLEGVKYENRKN